MATASRTGRPGRAARSVRRGRTGRAGRRPGESGTREAILDAARVSFGEVGYERTTIRGIAAVAGVDPALVHHFFGGKEGVFAAAMELPFTPSEALEGILRRGVRDAGEAILRLFFGIWEAAPGRSPLLALIRSAVTHEQAAAMLREFIGRELVRRLAAAIPGPESELRAELVGTQMVGLALLRYVVRVEPLASASPERIIAMAAPTIQAQLDGHPTRAARGGRRHRPNWNE